MTTLPIVLGSGFVSTVKINESVKVGQVIAAKTPDVEHVINLSKELSVPIEKAGKYLKKNPGETISAGDILAVKKGRFGISEKKFISKVSGVVGRYERDTGNLVLIEKSNVENHIDIVSPVDGIVVMCNNGKIVLGTEKQVYTCLSISGGSATGEIFVLEDSSSTSLYYDLDSRAVGKIIVGRNFTRDIIIKSIGIGALGIVGTKIESQDIDYLKGRHKDIPIFEVDDRTLDELKIWKGKKIYLNNLENVILFLHA